MSTQTSAIHSDPEILGGRLCSSVRVCHSRRCSTTWKAGDPLSEFLEDFPTVTRELAVAALEQAKDALLVHPGLL